MLSELRIENVGVIREGATPRRPRAVGGDRGDRRRQDDGGRGARPPARGPGRRRCRGCAGATEAWVEGRVRVRRHRGGAGARRRPKGGRAPTSTGGWRHASPLAEWGARFVDLHGQHAHQSLFATLGPAPALDQFGKVDLGPAPRARRRRRDRGRGDAALGGDARARAREIDLLRFQCGELDAAGLDDPDEDAQLRKLEDLLAGASAHREARSAARVQRR